MATAVYVLCALTAALCTWLLARAYVQSRARLLLWSCLCFVGLTLNNVVLFVDKVVAVHADLSAWRVLPAAVGLAILVGGLVWGSD